MDYAVGVREGQKLWVLTKGYALHGEKAITKECWVADSFCASKGALQFVPRKVCGPWFFDRRLGDKDYVLCTSRKSSSLRFGSHWRIYG